MIKRVLNLVMKEITGALRNNIALYGILFPLVLAVGMSLFLPGLQQMKLTVAVEKNIEHKVIEGLKQYANVEIYDTQEDVKERVGRPDDLAGIISKNGSITILLEGNEAGEAEGLAGALLDRILSDEPGSRYEHLSLGKTGSQARDLSGSLVILCAILVSGYVIGLGIVDEKESKAIRALAVSPLKKIEYWASHFLLALSSGVVLSVLSCLILSGTSINYLNVTIAVSASAGVSLIMAYIIGSLSDNLISAIAVIKVMMLFILGIPIGSLFIPQNLHWVFYLFPHYWSFQAFMDIYKNGAHFVSTGIASLAALATSIVVFAALSPMFSKKLQLR